MNRSDAITVAFQIARDVGLRKVQKRLSTNFEQHLKKKTIIHMTIRSVAELKAKIESSDAVKLTPSAEQLAICFALQSSNIIVDAIAGSGKTTTCLSIAAAFPDSKILLLTYNKRLKEEMKIKFSPFTNVLATNYHSYVVQIYKHPCHNDFALEKFLNTTQPSQQSTKGHQETYDYIILDEVQDMNPSLFRLVDRIYADSALHLKATDNLPKLVVLGDQKQAIYDFVKADSRFLRDAPSVFGYLNSYSWSHQKLSMSFRMTRQISLFLNECYLVNDKRMNACRDGPLPLYLFIDVWKDDRYRQLVPLIRQHGPGNTFVLAPSIKKDTYPARRFENMLSKEYKVPTYTCVGEDREINALASTGKVIITTFHQSKGMERDLVIVLGCDAGPWNRLTSPLEADNKLYVALTRAKVQLVCIHSFKESLLPYTSRDAVLATSKVVAACPDKDKLLRKRLPPRSKESDDAFVRDEEGHLLVQYDAKADPFFTSKNKIISDLSSNPPLGRNDSVTELLNFQSADDIHELLNQLCTVEELQSPLLESETNPLQDIAVIVPTDSGRYEEVSDLTGVIFQHAIEFDLIGTNKSLSEFDSLPIFWDKERPAIHLLTKYVTETQAMKHGYYGRSLQMTQKSFN